MPLTYSSKCCCIYCGLGSSCSIYCDNLMILPSSLHFSSIYFINFYQNNLLKTTSGNVLCYLKLFNTCTTAFEIKSNLLKMALSFIRISLNTINIPYALLRWTTCCFSNLLCTFFTLYLGIIYSFYTLNFNFFSSRYLDYPP